MSDLFAQAYNPDVLSCLANLSNDEVFTPPDIANQMLDMLPDEIWHDSSATFLDPACKSGVFLREIAKRLIDGLEDEFPELPERLSHIFHNQVFGVATTELCSLLSRRSAYCSKYPNSKYSVTSFEDASGEVRYKRIRHTWEDSKCSYCGASREIYDRDESLESYAYEFIHLDKIEELFPMKFDVIVGNPPYQLGNGFDSQQRDKPIYHLFIEQALKLKPRYLTMITPSRWFTGTWNLGSFPENMRADRHIEEMHDFSDASDCFPGVEIKGGVSFFLWSRDYDGDCKFVSHVGKKESAVKRPLLENGCDVIIRDNEGISILNKVRSKQNDTFDKIVSSQNPFGFNTAYHGKDNPSESRKLKLVCRGRKIEYISESEIMQNSDWVNSIKILIPKAGEGGALPNKIIGKPFIAKEGFCCTGTYMVVGPFGNAEEAESAISWMQTTLFRYLVSLRKITQDTKSDTYCFVPLLPWDRTYTNNMVNELFSLNSDEIKHMESQVTELALDELYI